MQDETVQFPPLVRLLRASTLLLALGAAQLSADASVARAEGGIAAAMGITSADGTVRTQAGVRLALSAPEQLTARQIEGTRNSLRGRMNDVHRCFSEAMIRSAAVDGSVVVELTAQARGRVQAKTKQDRSTDPTMAECMRASLSSAVLKGVPVGSKVDATLEINNPVAKLRAKQAKRSVLEDVHMLGGGMAESTGGTQENEVGYRVAGSAYASQTIGALNQQFQTNLPGLLDCRRKSSRRTRTAEGSLSLDISIEAGRMAVQTKSNSMNDRRAHGCIAAWLQRVDASQLASAQLDVTVSFAR